MDRNYEKQIVIFEEKDAVEVPAKEFTYEVGFWCNAKIINERDVTYPVKLEVRKGHSFVSINRLRRSAYFHGYITLYESISERREIVTTEAELLKLGKLRYVLYESGGGATNTGDAYVYCTLDGTPMKPMFVITKGHRSCGNHAAFGLWENQKVVEVYVSRWRADYYVRVAELTAARDGFVENVLWEASDMNDVEANIPDKLSKYQDAIVAAVKKSRCYHCREPHFVISK